MSNGYGNPAIDSGDRVPARWSRTTGLESLWSPRGWLRVNRDGIEWRPFVPFLGSPVRIPFETLDGIRESREFIGSSFMAQMGQSMRDWTTFEVRRYKKVRRMLAAAGFVSNTRPSWPGIAIYVRRNRVVEWHSEGPRILRLEV
jgi:hypothetical protein